MNIAVVAIGNSVMGDDGAGPAALALLRRRPRPEGVSLQNLERHSLGALGLLRDNHPLILLDALLGGQLPGTVYRISASRLKLGFASSLSLHELHLLHLAARFFPERLASITVLGVEPSRMVPGTGLSPAVRSALPTLVFLAEREVRRVRRAQTANRAFQARFSALNSIILPGASFGSR